MSLEHYRKGYAVMSADLKGIKIDGAYLNELKQWCRDDDVIAERIPVVRGFSISIMFLKFYKPFSFRISKNILWLHWHFEKIYTQNR